VTPQPTIAHYRLTSKLGEGGMGAVYRATDTKLNREVAIKILPDAFAQDPDRLARFDREAQLLAALNHPNIAAIYGIEQNALIMELVPGDDLRGPVPLDTALAYVRQIAAALEAAHEKGIVHRDLKPANIKVTPDGVVKLLDFGLGRADDPTPASNATISPTLTLRATQAGMILGTAAYMAPEQARGKLVDKRADIWAFGVVLYEMLTGAQLFAAGDTVTDIIAAVVTRNPDWSALPSDTPPRIRRLLERCLRKDPKLRLRDIGEARILIDEPEPPAPAAPAAAPRRSALPLALAATAATLLAAALGFGWWSATRPVLRPMQRLSVDLGPDAVRGSQASAWLSPDGTHLVYISRQRDGRDGLSVRRLDQSAATLLTPDGFDPFFSPDGQWVGFISDGKIKKVPLQGGAPITVQEVRTARGAAWTEDGTIIYGGGEAGLMAVSPAGGAPRKLTAPRDLTDYAHQWPHMLPGGKTLLFTGNLRAGEYDNSRIRALSLDTGTVKLVLEGGYEGRYLESGHLVFVSQNRLMAVRFDPVALETRGTPVALAEDLTYSEFGERFQTSPSGTLVYRSGKPGDLAWPIVSMDQSGQATMLVSRPGVYHTPRFSPDGKRLAATAKGPKGVDLWVFDLERGTPTQLTFDANVRDNEVVWTPSGRHIVFSSDDPPGLWFIRADGLGGPQRLLDASFRPQSFSPDGRRMATTRAGILTIPFDFSDPERPKAGPPEDLVRTPGIHDVEFSPDGRWIAHTQQGIRHEELFVTPLLPGGAAAGGKWKISPAGGKFPRWSRTARQLFYVAPDRRIMVVDYTVNGDSFTAGNPRVWSPTPILRTGVISPYDLAPDGKHIAAFPRPDGEREDTNTPHVTFLFNFADELKRRLP
jgi:serine/threonine-protein kinase